MHHSQLAWALAEAADGRLSPTERFDVYLALGAGDHDEAVRLLLPISAREHLALSRDVIAGLHIWVDANLAEDDDGRMLLAALDAPVDPAAPVAVTPPRYLRVSGAYQQPSPAAVDSDDPAPN